MNRLRVAAWCAALASCATTTTTGEEPVPRLALAVEELGAAGVACDGAPKPERGPTPEGVRIVATMRATADRPVPLDALEQMLVVGAMRRCAEGLSIHRATTADGEEGYLEAVGEAWVHGDPAPPEG